VHTALHRNSFPIVLCRVNILQTYENVTAGRNKTSAIGIPLTGQHSALPLAEVPSTATNWDTHVAPEAYRDGFGRINRCNKPIIVPVVCRNKINLKVTRPIGVPLDGVQVVLYSIRENSDCESESSETPHREFLPQSTVTGGLVSYTPHHPRPPLRLEGIWK
ncbi:hypothetical protein BJV78DRAFT_1355691, partial [Lactifluus subvellereus]